MRIGLGVQAAAGGALGLGMGMGPSLGLSLSLGGPAFLVVRALPQTRSCCTALQAGMGSSSNVVVQVDKVRESAKGGAGLQQRIKNASSVAAVLEVLNHRRCGHLNFSAGLHRLAKLATFQRESLSPKDHLALQDVLGEVSVCASEGRFSARQLCNMLWAVGKLQTAANFEPHDASINELIQQLALCVHEAKAGEVSMALWGCAVLSVGDDGESALMFCAPSHFSLYSRETSAPLGLLNAICRHLRSSETILQDMKARELAMVSWALAALNHYDLVLLEKLAQRIGGVIQCGDEDTMQPRDLGMIAWGFSQQCQEHWQIQECTLKLLSEVRTNNLYRYSSCAFLSPSASAKTVYRAERRSCNPPLWA
jgi:hypothetical protein